MAGKSLIPIKGISQALVEALGTQKIFDQTSLLLLANTPEERSSLASKLTTSVGHDIDVRNVNSWVRQADLLRIQDMTSDLAYLLTLIGIRCIDDLAKAAVDRMLPLLKALAAVHPDFHVAPDGRVLSSYVGDMVAAAIAIGKAGDYHKLNVTGEPEPAHLFNPDSSEKEGIRSDADIIQEGLSFLKDLPISLPLPRYISGTVKMRSINESDENAIVKRGLDVAILGVTSPDTDPSKTTACDSTTTDGNGRFILSLPDNYNLHDSISIQISQGSNSQKFTFSYSQLIDGVFLQCPDGSRLKAMDLLALYQELDALNDHLAKMEEELRLYYLAKQYQDTYSRSQVKLSAEQQEVIDRFLASASDVEYLQSEISKGMKQREEMLRKIYNVDAFTNDLQLTLNKVIDDSTLEAELPDIILTRELFMHQRQIAPCALPSVKLMGNDERAVYLATDTAPSRIFSYTMLQRLVEPILSSGDRKTISEPIDVLNFRKQIVSDPESYPKMGSLGIGYVLNMHQAWCPDGFALGDLLYSLILAPGEEQRVVVKEKSQTYAITDVAEGTDSNRNTSTQLQTDDTLAAFNSALSKLSEANGKVESKSSGWSVGASLGYGNSGVGVALNGGYSSTKSSSKSSSRQSNSMDEASAASQQFQHAIQTAAQKISQAKRMSIRTASSEESDSVASKIVANHNHMHTLTVQYWEVMRRYRLETCIDSVDLVLFVPFQPIRFLPASAKFFFEPSDGFCPSQFKDRYDAFIRYYDALRPALPYKYVQGLDLIQKYNAYPDWKMQRATDSEAVVITVKLSGHFLEFDDIQATLYLKNGRGSVRGVLAAGSDFSAIRSVNSVTSREELLEHIRFLRHSGRMKSAATFQFLLPEGVTEMDLSSVRFHRSAHSFTYTYPESTVCGPGERSAIDNYENELRKLYQDNDDSKGDRRRLSHYRNALPEWYLNPTVTLSIRELQYQTDDIELLGAEAKVGNKNISCTLSATEFGRDDVTANLSYMLPVLQRKDLQKIEATAQHIAAETIHYSKAIWSSLSASDRAMMLERYTIDLQFSSDKTEKADLEKVLNISDTNIPLLNCIDVNNVIGFYGNSMLFPFTYPEALAKKIGRSSKELQDMIYRYHASNFRVTSTIVSLPTQGMVGEAVLGETNVAEEIDLTRFWKWDDSPIDKMSITKDYFKTDKSYLNGKNTQEISALNLGSAELAKAIQSNEDLLSAVKSRSLANLFPELASTGLSQANTAIENGATAQKEMLANALNDSKKLASKALAVSDAVRTDDFTTQQAIEALSDPTKAADKAGGAGGSGSAGKPGAGSGTDGIGSINIYINGNQVKTDSATTKPAASTDGSKPAASTDGSKPAAPTDGSKPAASTDGSKPATK